MGKGNNGDASLYSPAEKMGSVPFCALSPFARFFIYGVIKSGKPFDMKKAMPKLDYQDSN